MALYHFSVTQVKRSAGQSAVACAAYRSGERLYSEYYGEYSDYTKKGGIIHKEILLPPHAPPEYADRQTLWNAVEKNERGKNAQLAYSFDIALQNEFSVEENIRLARQFLIEHFVSKGMVVDFAVHQPDKGKGNPNPHFHVLCPIRPLKENGEWGLKQRRVYVTDENGNRVKDDNGEYVFNAVPTTDWGNPKTLEYWRENWATMCNAKFIEMGLTEKIDNRSYERQGVGLLPTIHEGPKTRVMEKKGIRTEKGEFNRFIKSTNSLIRDVKKEISSLLYWIKKIEYEINKPIECYLLDLIKEFEELWNSFRHSDYERQKNNAEIQNTMEFLKLNKFNETGDMEKRVNELNEKSEKLNGSIAGLRNKMSKIRNVFESVETYKRLLPIYDGLQKIKFKRPREKYEAEHAAELDKFYAARRRLQQDYPDWEVSNIDELQAEYAALNVTFNETYAELDAVKAELFKLNKVKSNILTAEDFIRRNKEKQQLKTHKEKDFNDKSNRNKR